MTLYLGRHDSLIAKGADTLKELQVLKTMLVMSLWSLRRGLQGHICCGCWDPSWQQRKVHSETWVTGLSILSFGAALFDETICVWQRCCRSPKDHMKRRILSSGSKAQERGIP